MIEYIRHIQKDSANPSFLEVLLAYSGVHAVFFHRINHWLYRHGLKTIARIFSNIARMFTGVEIHPAAQIGKFLTIDHGTGVVIGQTAEIGDYVTLYQDVTLGGVRSTTEKRHPTLEDHVIIGAGAQILGDITIAEGAKIGANAVVLRDVPAGCTVVGNPARFVNCGEDEGRDYGVAPSKRDPYAEVIDGLLADVERLKAELKIKDETSSEDPSNDYAERWKGSGI